ncbi:uncharacterized protein PF3D7_1120600-like [Atheta coriaria]|uniref:uncharacterized protein PF3D7_1120600-like n=1 Tax=Dalotia coriaria TaxID=877792 RepID=UPI0031F3D23F
MLLHRVLQKPVNVNTMNSEVYPKRFNGNEVMDLHPLAYHMPGDAIEVFPSSQKGVFYAPGTKLERYGDFVKSEQDLYNEEDLEDRINHKQKLAKRKCADSLAETDFKVPELFGSNKSHPSSIDQPLSEFYYSIPHDVIGLNQDLLGENRDVNNVSCKKFRRSLEVAHWDDNNHLLTRKKKKAIKIKIFDDGELIKNIEKNKDDNSVVLTIKNNEETKEKLVKSNNNDNNNESKLTDRKASDNDQKVMGDDDNTLEKIDTIIKHDQESLKQFTQRPLNQHQNQRQNQNKHSKHVSKDDANNSSNRNGEVSNRREDNVEDDQNHPRKVSAHRLSHAKKYNRVNEMGTTVVPYVSPTESNEYPGVLEPRLENSYKPQYLHHHHVNEYQNKLEDQTEPTSAAEQRELGKNFNDFRTEPMSIKTTSEKVIIIPFKKSINHESQVILIDPVVKEEQNGDDKLGYGLRMKESDVLYDVEIDNENPNKKLLRNTLDEEKFMESLNEEDKSKSPRSDVQGQSINHQDQPKADAFRSRKLFAIDIPQYEYVDESENEDLRDKKDVREVLGMRKDEDYSEDKIDVFGDNDKPKKKKKTRNKLVDTKRENERKIRQRLLGSLINSQQERRALKVKLAKTKSNKVKKDVNNVREEDLASHDDNYQHLIIKNHEEDQLADSADEEEDKTKQNNNNNNNNNNQKQHLVTTIKDNVNLDRCCENKNNNKVETTCSSDTSDSLPPEPPPQPEEQIETGETGGNELDIIEKTQAILLHITGPPCSHQLTPKPIEDDNNDGPDSKRSKSQVDIIDTDSPLTVEHLNSYKVTSGEKNPENVVSEIIKLVQNYKEKVNEYNKNNRKEVIKDNVSLKPGKASTHAPEIDLRKELQHNHVYEHKNNKNNDLTPETTTLGYTQDISEGKKVLSSDDEDDSAIHAHAIMHSKKLHPVKSNKCDIKSGNDRAQEFILPMSVQEGYIKPEVVADGNAIDNDSSNNADADKNVKEVDNFTNVEDSDENIKTKQKRDNYLKHNNNKQIENPLKFTPDNLESFNDVIERDEGQTMSKREETLHKARIAHYLNPGLLNEDEIMNHQVYKRDLHDDDKDYTEEELDKLIGMVDDSSTDVQSDQDLLKRYRRYKNFEPFLYNNIPRHRNSEEAGMSSEHSIVIQTTVATTNLQCGEVEYKKTLETGAVDHIHKKKNKKKSHGHRCNFGDDEEFGDTCTQHLETPKKSKSQISLENKQKEQTRERIMEDKLSEKQKEQEHIKNVLNGHLVLDIMEKFHTKVKGNDRLNNRFGQAMGKKCAADEVDLIDKFKEEQSKADVRHAQLMLHQVIVLMNKIVAEQVHRRTCLVLSPTLKNYLKRTAGNRERLSKSNVVAEGYPLPPVKGTKGSANKDLLMDESQGDFLFPQGGDEDQPLSAMDAAILMKKKINMIRALLAKYNHMSHSCQVKVQPVHDYLIQHLKALEKMSQNKKFGDVPDACEVPCVHNQEAGPGRGAGGKESGRSPEPEFNGGSTTIIFSTGEEVSSQSSGMSSLAPGGEATSLTISPGGDINQSKAKARDATLKPPHYKANNQKRIFRHYDDGDSDTDNDSDQSAYPSEKYRKLVEAAANYRRKRQIEERLARLFGKTRTKKAEPATTSKNDENVEPDLSNAAFEAPVVYSLH